MSRNLALFATLALLAVGLAGCTSDDHTVVIAFTQTDDDLSSDKDPQRLADWLAQATGHDVEIYPVSSTQAAIEAMRGGHADIGFFDGAAAWFAWKEFDFDAIAADVNSDGRDHYVASAWVLADSEYQSMRDLEGARSCHTGMLKSAGMFMPLGWLVKEGYVEVQGDPEDLASIEPTVKAYFSEASIPESGPYYNYEGALRCLTEDAGDVAFIKDTTPETYCGDDGASWCLPLASYREVQDFGRVPSHAAMARPGLDAHERDEVQAALLALAGSDEGRSILEDILETDHMVAVTSEGHLGEYGANLAHVPGIQAYVDDKLQ